jgi:hypothetical protein
VVVTAGYLLLAVLAAACFYLAAPHQYLVLSLQRHQVALRISGVALCVVAILLAGQSLGFWAGFFAVLTTLMLGCVMLPYIDAWRSHRNPQHVD